MKDLVISTLVFYFKTIIYVCFIIKDMVFVFLATLTPDGHGTPTFGDSWTRSARLTCEYSAFRGDRYAGN